MLEPTSAIVSRRVHHQHAEHRGQPGRYVPLQAHAAEAARDNITFPGCAGRGAARPPAAGAKATPPIRIRARGPPASRRAGRRGRRGAPGAGTGGSAARGPIRPGRRRRDAGAHPGAAGAPRGGGIPIRGPARRGRRGRPPTRRADPPGPGLPRPRAPAADAPRPRLPAAMPRAGPGRPEPRQAAGLRDAPKKAGGGCSASSHSEHPRAARAARAAHGGPAVAHDRGLRALHLPLRAAFHAVACRHAVLCRGGICGARSTLFHNFASFCPPARGAPAASAATTLPRVHYPARIHEPLEPDEQPVHARPVLVPDEPGPGQAVAVLGRHGAAPAGGLPQSRPPPPRAAGSPRRGAGARRRCRLPLARVPVRHAAQAEPPAHLPGQRDQLPQPGGRDGGVLQ